MEREISQYLTKQQYCNSHLLPELARLKPDIFSGEIVRIQWAFFLIFNLFRLFTFMRKDDTRHFSPGSSHCQVLFTLGIVVVLRLKAGYTRSLFFCRGWVHCGVSMLSCRFAGICWRNGILIYRLPESRSWKEVETRSRSSSRVVAANKWRLLSSSHLQIH